MSFLQRFTKFSAILACGLISTNTAYSQSWQSKISNDSNFFEIRNTFDEYYVAPADKPAGDEKQFKRWAYIMGPRVTGNNGMPIAPDIIYTEWKKYLAKNPLPASSGKNNAWVYAGPKTTPTRGGGNGRINCLKFHPDNTEIMWAGTPAGGLWKTVNGGKSWETKTDNLPNLGVTDIAINPRYPDSIFMATGDGFGYSIGNGNFWGGTYSMGVLLSTNGGETWQETGLNWQRNQTRQIHKLLMHPQDPNKLYATTNTGIWASVNAGKDWQMIKSGNGFKDLIYHPTKAGWMVASTSTAIFYSADTGKTWLSSEVKFSRPTIALAMAYAPSADSIIYTLVNYSPNNGGLYKSTDYGVTFTEQPGFIFTTFQGWYDLAIGVSPVNPHRVIIGGLDMMRTDNAGQEWKTISDWYNWPLTYYVHADHRAIVFYPGKNDSFLSVNDGGVFRTYNGGQTWTNISSNIQALQFYKIGSMPSHEGTLFAGAQDNGVNRGKSGSWQQVMGADGMEIVASHADPNIVYASTQNGNLSKSFNGGSSFTKSIYPTKSSWVTPVEMDRYDADVLYFGARHLYKTVNGGDSWENITPGLNVAGEITSIELTADPKILYIAHTTSNAASAIRLRRTLDNGKTWTLINKGLPAGNLYLSDIASDPKDPEHIWITISGYNAANKVFESKDAGNTWENISDGLPNVPVNCVQTEGSLEKGVYVGTDLGVFYRSLSTPGWQFFNNDLPLVMVNELEVLPQFNKIRAATYGRGVWEAPLAGTVVSVDKFKALTREIHLYPNPAQTKAYIRYPESSVQLKEIRIYDVTGKLLQTLKPETYAGNLQAIDTKHFPAGVYMVNIVTEEGVFTKKLNVIN